MITMSYTGARLQSSSTSHRFAIGQAVRLRGGIMALQKTASTFTIIAMLPPRDGSPQYRMRNDDERYERVATEDSIESADPSVEAAA